VRTILVAKTQAAARLAAPEGVEPLGVRGSCYSTPDKVIFSGPIQLDEKVWDWLMRDVHLFDVREVEWQ
jgi:hypothetical protein